MKKKIDPLVVLAVLVVSGVILSHFVVFSQAEAPLLHLNSVAEKSSVQSTIFSAEGRINPQWQPSRQLVKIDPPGQRTR